jgi:hypothetical protein
MRQLCVNRLCYNSMFCESNYLWTRMVLLENAFEVRKSLFIMLLNNDTCNAIFWHQFLQQYILLAKRHFLVSDYMFYRILNALNSYFGLPAMKALNVSIRPSNNFVLVGNQPYSLWVTTTTGFLLVGWFIQNPIILTKVACCKRTQSDFILCHFILPKC